jgi:hypothetical protein
LEEEIRERIFKGNKAFYANRAVFKIKIKVISVRPVVVYGSETWARKEVLYRDCLCLRGKYLGKFFDQLKKIMVIGGLIQT